jgi:hypothetical protein
MRSAVTRSAPLQRAAPAPFARAAAAAAAPAPAPHRAAAALRALGSAAAAPLRAPQCRRGSRRAACTTRAGLKAVEKFDPRFTLEPEARRRVPRAGLRFHAHARCCADACTCAARCAVARGGRRRRSCAGC